MRCQWVWQKQYLTSWKKNVLNIFMDFFPSLPLSVFVQTSCWALLVLQQQIMLLSGLLGGSLKTGWENYHITTIWELGGEARANERQLSFLWLQLAPADVVRETWHINTQTCTKHTHTSEMDLYRVAVISKDSLFSAVWTWQRVWMCSEVLTPVFLLVTAFSGNHLP